VAPERLDDTQPLAVAGRADHGWVVDGRYRVLERLGLGGTADVFRAHDEVLGRDVAVKVFRTALVDDPDGHGAQRRELELQSLARLSHPNLVTLFDGDARPGVQPYLALELVPGADLATRLHDGPLPEPEVRALGMQVADGLAYAHARGIVHRDVKPANILLGSDGPDDGVRARLSDFGTVRLLDGARMTAADLTLGTASYLAPEQARGADVGPEADVYALGLVLIEALTGRRCFAGAPHEVLAARLTTSPVVPDGLPEPWPALLTAMTAADPAARPTAAQVVTALRTGAPPTLPSGVLPVAARAGRAHRRGAAVWFALAAAACVGLLAGAGILVSGNGHDSTPGQNLPVAPTTHHSAHPSHHRQPSGAAELRAVPGSATREPGRTHSAPARRHTLAPVRVVAPSSRVSSASSTAASSAPATTSPATSASPAPTDTSSAAPDSSSPTSQPTP
jgi:serine/threonine protein kinase